MVVASVILLTVVVALLGHHWFRLSTRRWRLLSQFPGDRPLPLIGNALQIGFDTDNIPHNLMDMWRRHGKRNFRLSLGSQDWIMLCEPVDVGIILSHQNEISKPDERNAAIMPFFGNSVSTSEGAQWRFIRKLMSSSFHFKTLDQKLALVNNLGDKLVEKFGCLDGNNPVDVYKYLAPMMYDLFCKSFAGIDTNLLDQLDHEYLNESRKITKMVTTNYFSYWRHYESLFKWTTEYRKQRHTIKTIQNNSDNIINQRREILNKIKDDIMGNNHSVDDDVNIEELVAKKLSEESCLLDDLLLGKLPNGDPIPDQMINDEICLLSFTGHYTGTMTISHTLFIMAKYPDVQRRVLEEQYSIFGKDNHRQSTSKDLSEMKFLEAVVKETMRVIPTVPKIARQLINDMTLKDGRVIPAGTSVVVYFEALFQNPEVFPDSDCFTPERFFETMHTFAFMPFSAGPRNCIGFRFAWVAMRSILSNIIRRYEILPGVEPQFMHRIITESENGVQLKLKRRS